MSKELIERLDAEEADEAGMFMGTTRVVPMSVANRQWEANESGGA